MNTQKMSDSEIMMLPDHLFGRRWIVGVEQIITAASTEYGIIEAGLPDRTVIWELLIDTTIAPSTTMNLTIALGDHAANNAAEFLNMEKVFTGINSETYGIGGLTSNNNGGVQVRTLRKLIIPQSRKFVVEFVNGSAQNKSTGLYLIISSVPTELPAWS